MLIGLHEGGPQQSLGTATLGVKGYACICLLLPLWSPAAIMYGTYQVLSWALTQLLTALVQERSFSEEPWKWDLLLDVGT